jgi:hypothetical protein
MTVPLAAVVDTATDLTWLPMEALRSIGIKARGKRMLGTGKHEMVEREVGYAILRANGSETVEEVVFGEAGDAVRLGSHAMGGFGVTMEDDTRFISLTSMMAFSARQRPNTFAHAA